MALSTRKSHLLVLFVLLAALLPQATPARAATLTVTTLSDSGTGSLRDALSKANSGDTINFSVSGTITPTSPLPALKGGVTIDGGSGYNVVIDGAAAGSSHGLTVTSDGNTIRGLVIIGFRTSQSGFESDGAGIYINGADNRVTTCYIGVAKDGINAAGNGTFGVLLGGGANNNTIEANVVSGNRTANIALLSTDVNGVKKVTNNQIVRNKVGTNAQGTAAISGADASSFNGGIYINNLAEDNTIRDNVIGGNISSNINLVAAGIQLASSSTAIAPQGNIITANYIGTNTSGTQIPNSVGISFVGAGGAFDTTVGPGNYISGNESEGVLFDSVNMGNNTITANWIGLRPDSQPLGNGTHGVHSKRVATSAVITVGPDNVIAANGENGVYVNSDNGTHVITGNYIGTDKDGARTPAGFANVNAGVRIDAGSNNRIGGTTSDDRNIIGISSGSQLGVLINSADTSGNTIIGNYIGVNAAGSGALQTSPDANSVGIEVRSSASNTIENNVISGIGIGVKLYNAGTTGNKIQANQIGVAANGTGDLGNRKHGVQVITGPNGGPTNNIIGALDGSGNPDRSKGNLIANNGKASTISLWYHGVSIEGDAADSNIVAGNQIRNNGGDGSGEGGGVYVKDASGIKITQSTTTNNNGAGIRLCNDFGLACGNNDIAPPVISVSGVTVTGSTSPPCAGCTIEIFSSPLPEEGEGPSYVTSGTTNSGGTFSIDALGCERFVTATVTDNNNNTSPFSNMTQECRSPTPPNVNLSAGTPTSSSASPQLVNPGSPIVYEHTLQNTGDLAGTFTITANSDKGWSVQLNQSSVSLQGGDSTTIRVTITVPPGAAPGTDQTTVRASVGDKSQSRINYSRVPQIYGVEITPATQTGTVKPVASQNVIDYEHTITNTGNGQDTITLSAATSDSSFATTFPDGATCTLNANQSCTRRVRVTFDITDQEAVSATTTVTATSSDGTTSDQATDITTVARAATILPGTLSESALPGETVVFQHTVQNTGDVPRNLTLSVTGLPTGWTTVFTPTGSFSLNQGDSRTVELAVTVPAGVDAPDAGTQETAQLTVTPQGASDLAVSAFDTITVLLQPDFAFTAATQPSLDAFPGQTVSFTHTLTNQANGSDSFTITPVASSGLTIISVEPTSPVQLARDGSTPVVVTARVNNGVIEGTQTIDLTAETDSTPAPTPITQQDTVNVQGAAIPKLSDGYAQNADPGATVIFTHTLENIGNKAGDFTVSSPTLPAGWSAVENDPNNCLSALPAGSTCEFGVTVTVAAEADAGPNSFDVTVSSAEGVATITDTVNVNAVPGLEFTPNLTGNADPGQPAVFDHTLTNTGNGPDTFTITLTTDPGWEASITPTLVTDLPRDQVVDVTVTVTAPTGVRFGTVGVVTATAISALDPNPQASVVDETTINEAPGAELIPDEQTLYAQPEEDQPVTATFFHELRNSGSKDLAYTLTTSGDRTGWTSVVSPTETGELAPGETVPISVSVTMPAGTPRDEQNVTTVEVRELGGVDPLLATATDTTIAGSEYGVLLEPPINYGTALPGKTRTYTHTITNIGASTDSFVFSTINNFGWETSVAPSSIDLPAGGSSTITVFVRVPTVAVSNTLALPPNIATVIARSVADPTISGSAEERTEVLQVAGVSLSPGQFSPVSPRSNLVTFRHTLLNTGNGVDTFTLNVTSDQGWPVTVTPLQQTLAAGRSYPVEVQVEVPSDIPPGTIGRVAVTATSRSDPSMQSAVENVLLYSVRGDRPDPDPSQDKFIYLPLIAR